MTEASHSNRFHQTWLPYQRISHVARFQHAVSHRRCVRRQRFAPMSLFFVAPDAYSQSFSVFFSVANVTSFFTDETNKDNIIQQLV